MEADEGPPFPEAPKLNRVSDTGGRIKGSAHQGGENRKRMLGWPCSPLFCFSFCRRRPALISLWPAISLSPNTVPSIKLQSSDGEIFEVDVETVKQSVTIKTMLEDLGMDDEGDDPVPLPNVNAAILKKVIQWCTHHKVDPCPPEDDENKESEQMTSLLGIKNS